MKHKNTPAGLGKKHIVILSLAVILVIVGTITVFAALRDTSGVVTEQLEEAAVTCEVNSDYAVKNTGNVPALVRVRVVVNKTDGGEIIPGDVPAYTVGSDWTKIGDYLYYNGILTKKDGGDDTTSTCIRMTPASDTQVVVIAEAIQAASDAAKESWGVSYSNGNWS